MKGLFPFVDINYQSNTGVLIFLSGLKFIFVATYLNVQTFQDLALVTPFKRLLHIFKVCPPSKIIIILMTISAVLISNITWSSLILYLLKPNPDSVISLRCTDSFYLENIFRNQDLVASYANCWQSITALKPKPLTEDIQSALGKIEEGNEIKFL